MQRVQEKFCPNPPADSPALMRISLSLNEPYLLSCDLAAGHAMLVTMTRYDSAGAAKAAFDFARQDHSATTFHDYANANWTQQYGPNPAGTQFMVWQPEMWLIEISSSNDTPYKIAADPGVVAEFIFQQARTEGMLK